MSVCKLRKGQSTAEYVIVLGLIVGVVIAMQSYVKRGFQGRVKQATGYVEDAGILRNSTPVMSSEGDLTWFSQRQAFTGAQYEPYYLTSNFTTDRLSARTEHKNTTRDTVERRGVVDSSGRKGNQNISAYRGAP